MNISLTQTDAAIAAARQVAERLSIAVTIAVLDSGTQLKAFARMDLCVGCSSDAIDIGWP